MKTFLLVLAGINASYAFMPKIKINYAPISVRNPLDEARHFLQRCRKDSSTLMSSSEPESLFVPPGKSLSSTYPESSQQEIVEKFKIGGLFGLWFVLSIGYNIYNKVIKKENTLI